MNIDPAAILAMLSQYVNHISELQAENVQLKKRLKEIEDE